MDEDIDLDEILKKWDTERKMIQKRKSKNLLTTKLKLF